MVRYRIVVVRDDHIYFDDLVWYERSTTKDVILDDIYHGTGWCKRDGFQITIAKKGENNG